MPATIASVDPTHAKAGDAGITIIGTGFADDPTLSTVWFRLHGEQAWLDVAPARVTYVSATEISFAIDAANTDGWTVGVQDIGVGDFGDTEPDAYLASALLYYEEEDMATTITDVYPSDAKAGDAGISIIGTGFLEAPSKSVVLFRAPAAETWELVAPARVTYVSATKLTIAIDVANTDGWNLGLNDVGVADYTESVPDAYLEGALFFYVPAAFSPDDVMKGAPDALYIEGRFMGHTHGGLTLAHGVDTSEVEVDQSLMPLRILKAGETFGVSVPLAEVTLENIRALWGISAAIEELDADRRRLTFGGDTEIAEVPVMIVVPAGAGKKWAITLYRCAVTSPGDLVWSRDDQVDLPLTIQVMADTSRPAGDQVGRFEEYAV